MRESREVSIVREKALADKVEGFLPAIVVISALTGFSVLAWYAYHQGTQSTSEDGLLVVEADKTPMKEKPLDPGGMKFPNQDKTIFETFANGSQPAKVERVLPSPEEPMPRGADTSGTQTWVNQRLHKNVSELEAVDKAVAAEAGKREQVIGDDSKKINDDEDAAPIQPVSPSVAMLKPDKLSSSFKEAESANAPEVVGYTHQPPVEKPAQTSVIKAATWEDAAKEIKDDDAPTAPAAPVELKSVESKQAAVYAPPKKEAEKPAAAPTSKGAFKVQLGAYPSEAEAKKDFARISKKFPAASGHGVVVVKAELPKGTFYRLRLAGFGSSADAKAFCAKLSSGGQACIVAKD
ncbi:MAG: SPOR domain-containing protein [Alphaproteobacteria bacterium]|nr:SPOR domain-containing protein [Alphaproteobacteria bacterium]